MDPLIKRLLFLREASNVRRCHTLPHHGEYTVGKHTFDCITLLFLLYPREPSIELVRALVLHDLPERFLGDLPSPLFKNNTLLMQSFAKAERDILDSFGFTKPDLTEEEEDWLICLDKVELYFWAIEQIFQGNANARNYVDGVREWFQEKDKASPNFIPKPIRKLVLGKLEWKRLKDVLDKED